MLLHSITDRSRDKILAVVRRTAEVACTRVRPPVYLPSRRRDKVQCPIQRGKQVVESTQIVSARLNG